MVDKNKGYFSGSDSRDSPDKSHNENKHIVEIAKITARRAAEADFKGQLARLRSIRQLNKNTHE